MTNETVYSLYSSNLPPLASPSYSFLFFQKGEPELIRTPPCGHVICLACALRLQQQAAETKAAAKCAVCSKAVVGLGERVWARVGVVGGWGWGKWVRWIHASQWLRTS